MQRPIGKRLITWLIIALVIYGFWLTFLYFKQETLIYPGAYFSGRDRAEALPDRVERVWVETTPGVRAEGWFLAGSGCSGDRPGAAVMLMHGNAEWIDDTTYFLHEYSRRGVSVLSCEYRGFGRSGGVPCQDGITADMVAFYDWLAARPDVNRERILYHGQSIGGGVAAQVAVQRKPAALILQSTFSSLATLSGRYLAPPSLCKHPWCTDQILPTLGVPVLLLHGIQDSLIPVEHARMLHRITPNSELVEMEGEHNHFPRDQVAFWKAIEAFLARNGIQTQP